MVNSLITEYGTIEGTRHWDNDKIDNTGINNAQSSMHATLTKLNVYIRSFCNCNTLLLASAMTFFPDVHVKAEWLVTLLGMNDDPTLSRHNHKLVKSYSVSRDTPPICNLYQVENLYLWTDVHVWCWVLID